MNEVVKAIILNEYALRILLPDQDFRKYVIRHAADYEIISGMANVLVFFNSTLKRFFTIGSSEI